MTIAWMLAVVLVADQTDGPVEAPVPARRMLSPDELRSAYSNALQISARKTNPDPFTVVPVVIEVFEQLKTDKSLSHAERSRLRRGLKSRLESLRDRVLRAAIVQKRQLRRIALRAEQSPRQSPRENLSGGGEIARAAELIELIQNTIAPDSWDINGGNGSIRYFSLLRVLVVRQTGEVHHQIRSGLSQLKN
jgi:hypothetical protein